MLFLKRCMFSYNWEEVYGFRISRNCVPGFTISEQQGGCKLLLYE